MGRALQMTKIEVNRSIYIENKCVFQLDALSFAEYAQKKEIASFHSVLQ
jgi:hypothetical protein